MSKVEVELHGTTIAGQIDVTAHVIWPAPEHGTMYQFDRWRHDGLYGWVGCAREGGPLTGRGGFGDVGWELTEEGREWVLLVSAGRPDLVGISESGWCVRGPRPPAPPTIAAWCFVEDALARWERGEAQPVTAARTRMRPLQQTMTKLVREASLARYGHPSCSNVRQRKLVLRCPACGSTMGDRGFTYPWWACDGRACDLSGLRTRAQALRSERRWCGGLRFTEKWRTKYAVDDAVFKAPRTLAEIRARCPKLTLREVMRALDTGVADGTIIHNVAARTWRRAG